MSSADGVELCRITVVGPSRRVDIALPGYVPFADLFPAVARYAGLDGPDVVAKRAAGCCSVSARSPSRRP